MEGFMRNLLEKCMLMTIAILVILFAANPVAAYSPNPYAAGYWGECTWYAYEKWPQISQKPPSTGNGYEWIIDARTKNYDTGTVPQVGAIAVWDSNAGGAYSNGHVAYVEEVSSATYFKVSEYNWNTVHGLDTRWVTRVSGINFIYPQNSAASGYASVSALAVSPTSVTLGQNFNVTFTLKEIHGAAKTFDQVALAILKSDGTYVYDAGMFDTVTVAANGTLSKTATSSLYTSNPAGIYKAVVRGNIGGTWFDFDTTGSGANPVSFSAVQAPPPALAAPVLVSPGEAIYGTHTAINYGSVPFHWSRNNTAASYVLAVRDITGYADDVSTSYGTAVLSQPVGDAGSYTWSGAQAGKKYRWTVTALKSGYNDAAATAIVFTTKNMADTTGPTLSISTLANGAITNNPTLNISGTVSDASGISTLTVNGQAVTISGNTFSRAVTLQQGSNTITTIAIDTANNKTTDTRTITLDTTAPVLTINAPADNSTTAQATTNVSGSTDETSTVTVKVNSGSLQSAAISGKNFNATVNLASGANTLNITATDLAGNSGNAKRTVTYDNTKPTLAVSDPGQDITTDKNSLTLHGTVSDALSAVTISITMDGQTFTPAVTSGAFQQQLTFTTAKQYTITVTATDAASNSSTVQRNVIYQPAAGGPKGDCNGDGNIDIMDALLALQYALNLIPHNAANDAIYLAAADVAPLDSVTMKPKGDGKIDVMDALVILQRAVNLLSW
jgi:surface antigen